MVPHSQVYRSQHIQLIIGSIITYLGSLHEGSDWSHYCYRILQVYIGSIVLVNLVVTSAVLTQQLVLKCWKQNCMCMHRGPSYY